MYNPVFGKIKFIEEEEVMGMLCKWVKCSNCNNQVFTAYDTVVCDECKPRDIIKSDKYNKKNIPDSIRWAVWERDNFTCKKCGTRKNLSVDHIYPEAKGGEATMDNCQTLCKRCNSSKGAR
jgi:hypothetical protein